VRGSPECGRERCRDERAAVLVEFSLVFVLFAFICYALVAFGLAMNLKSNLTHAAAEGARTAVGAGLCKVNDANPAVAAACIATKEAAAKSKTIDAVKAQGSTIEQEVTNKVTAIVALCDGSATAYCMTVTIPYDYGAHPIVPSAPGLGVVMPDTLNADAVVQLTN
jgi:Flp pilus assembly protein TadG